MNGSTLSAPTSATGLPSSLAPGSAAPRPAGTRGPSGGSLVALGFALLFGVSIVPSWLYYHANGQGVPWSRLLSESLSWVLWALLLPAVAKAARRFPIDRETWRWALPAHVGLGTLVVAANSLLTLIKNQAVLASQTGSFAPGFLSRLPEYLVVNFQAALVIYGGIVTAVHAYDGFRRLGERELAATRLEADLSRAQLTVLKMQLEPHFLFNTLNAISALVHGNPDGAERMVVRLSELLRMSLSSADKDEVPLEEELRFLGVYLEIQQTRFGDRLRVTQEIPEGARAALVPNLLLQPLVENAIRHGLERRAAPLAIAIRAERIGNRLRLEVEDDGPGLPDEAVRRNGVGLANTRARLERLYGIDHLLNLANRPEGGTRVTMELPQR
ncbi:MAG TPA: histidine kinase [Thermoanaerobaculia bacterium]|nr:histidine kinase [Thermoanaerobaculia bacterium]